MAAGNLYLLLGFVGAVLIAILGFPISDGLHLSTNNFAIAPEVFLFVAASFAADRLVIFTSATLSGLRRFGTMNAITVVAVLVRLVGSLLVLWAGLSVLAIAFWNAVVSVLWAWVALKLVSSVEPRLRFRLGSLRWRFLRPHLSFGILSFLTALAGRVIWDVAPLVVGFFHGSASIVPYSIGRRFPIAVNDLNNRAAETFFPAASERMTANDWAGSRGVLLLGTRWILVMALPLCIMLSVLAPNLLHAWIGSSSQDAVLIMRLTYAAVLAEALGMGAMHVLWGRGAVRTIFVVLSVLAIPSLALTLGLVRAFGAVGAAFALCISLFSSACIFLLLGARTCRLRTTELLRETFRGLFIPNAACLLIACFIVRLIEPQHWMGTIMAGLIGGVTYLVVLYFSGARDEERQFIPQTLAVPPWLGTSWPRLRRTLGKVPFMRGGYALMLTLRDLALDNPQRNCAWYNRQFKNQTDPWNGLRTGQVGYQIVIRLLDAARGSRRFGSALEVGCAEGIFTQSLATRCESLQAVDFSEIALERARDRCRRLANVRFDTCDLRRDSLPGQFDLVVVMGVLETFKRPWAVGAARDKLVNAVCPGGYLLIRNSRQSELFESSWWGKWLLRGGKWISIFMARHPQLKMVSEDSSDQSVSSLFQKLT